MERVDKKKTPLITFVILRSVWLFLGLMLVGCGYHYGATGIAAQYKTIKVPYIEGDWDGGLTAAVIKEISTQGVFHYRRDEAALNLKIKILKHHDHDIGFRYEQKKDGELKHTIVPVETRLSMNVEILILETHTEKAILGPVVLSGYVDFDHDFYSSRNGVNVFSLGQLSDYDDAYDAALRPLNELMAQKIVTYIHDAF